MKDRSKDPLHHEQTLLPLSYIMPLHRDGASTEMRIEYLPAAGKPCNIYCYSYVILGKNGLTYIVYFSMIGNTKDN